MQSDYPIHYRFRFRDGTVIEFEVRLDPETLLIRAPLPQQPPSWARLDFERCSNCSLDPATHPLCPTAAHLVEPVDRFSKTLSFTEAEVTVTVPERTYMLDTTVQTGLSALLGIYMSASGCPVLARLRPMVRYHLPFASPQETMFRSVSAYLVGQFLQMGDGQKPDWSLTGLAETYRQTGEVNRCFARRLRAAASMDASINALILLDIFAKTMPDTMEARVKEMRKLFAARG